MTKPVVLGLTGSIGMGKSTTAEMFREAGIPVWDADAAVDGLYVENGRAVAAIKAHFPGAVVNGAVDRSVLKERIATDPGVLGQLNAIVHPLVRENREAFLQKHASQPIVLLDVPLLFETGLSDSVDRIVVVTIDAAEQKRRVLARGEMSEEMFEIILAKQTPDAEKRAGADYIIATKNIDSARADVARIIKELTP